MRVMIVVPRQDRVSGNWVTAQRFQSGLEKHGHQVVLYDTRLQPEVTFREELLNFNPDVTILLHAYRSGKPWQQASRGLGIPYLVVLTGTDVNHGLNDPEQSQTIAKIIRRASFTVLQNPLIAAEFAINHVELSKNLHVLTPGILLGRSPYSLRSTLGITKDQTLFLCPAGLRPVKGVLELLEMFDQVVAATPDCHLAFCGPILDESYGRRFLTMLEQKPWASYLGSIPLDSMTSAMRGADVIINNSQAEGLANALLEAAAIGVPILARNIPGNAAVVKHESNGLLYASQAEFCKYSLQLLRRERRQELTSPDPQRYSADHETTALIALLREAIIN